MGVGGVRASFSFLFTPVSSRYFRCEKFLSKRGDTESSGFLPRGRASKAGSTDQLMPALVRLSASASKNDLLAALPRQEI